MKTTVSISKESFEKLKKIKLSRPQDNTNAETFDYILRVFEESPLRVERGMNPIPAKYAEAPTKNNLYKESKK